MFTRPAASRQHLRYDDFKAPRTSGANFIGGRRSAQGTRLLSSVDALNGDIIGVPFHEATIEEVDAAVMAASRAFAAYRARSCEQRACFLEMIGQEIDGLDEIFVEVVQRETALPVAMIRAERHRAAHQFRMLATALRRGDWMGIRIDAAVPSRGRGVRAEIRQHRIGLGPVAVIGSGSFPLAFSTAGADTASALAAGCPVVYKAHPSHMLTSELVADVIERAIDRAGMPPGIFNMLHGPYVASDLVRHPFIRAVGFTGSHKVGRMLCDIAQSRHEPIPVYAGMSSANPVILLPAAVRRRGSRLASALVSAVTQVAGQSCTAPRLVIGIRSKPLTRLIDVLQKLTSRERAQPMVSIETLGDFHNCVSNLAKRDGISLMATAREERGLACTRIFKASASIFLAGDPIVQTELFGPALILVEVRDRQELLALLTRLPGQLTATIIGEATELGEATDIVAILEEKAGRILVNDLPKREDLSEAIVHGGPWPVSSDTRYSATGALAIDRFLRPVCYQNMPEFLLPEGLRDENILEHNRDQEREPRNSDAIVVAPMTREPGVRASTASLRGHSCSEWSFSRSIPEI